MSVSAKQAVDILQRFPITSIQDLDEVDFLLEAAQAHREKIYASFIKGGMDVGQERQKSKGEVVPPIVKIIKRKPQEGTKAPSGNSSSSVATAPVQTPEPSSQMKWGDSPSPSPDEGDQDDPGQDEDGSMLPSSDLPKVTLTKIMQEQKIESDKEKKVLFLIDFCKQGGHKCCYTFRGESDVVHHNKDLIDHNKLYITGLPREVNPQVVRDQIYGVLPAKLKPSIRRERRREGDDGGGESGSGDSHQNSNHIQQPPRPDISYNEGATFAFVRFPNHHIATLAFLELQKPQTAKTLQNIKVNFASRSK